VIAEFYFLEQPIKISKKQKWNIYRWAACIIPLFSLGILYFLSGSFKLLVDFAAGLSFLSAPFLAWFNYKLITGKQMPEALRPKRSYRIFSLSCFVLLLAFCGVYVWYYFLA
jgi:Mn2+/Fe2+ NRAMP family transporter